MDDLVAPGLPDDPIRLHLSNDTTLDRLLDHNVDDADSIMAGRKPTHVLVPLGPYDEQHLIEFRDDGWTIQHTLTERIDGGLFSCPLSRWTGGDPGVRGLFCLNPDGSLGERTVA